MKAVHILDVIVECLSCGDEALAIDSDVTNEGLRCRFCGKEVIVKMEETMDITRAAIASPHFEACRTCRNEGQNGCNLESIEVSVYLGDWIICDCYCPTEEEE